MLKTTRYSFDKGRFEISDLNYLYVHVHIAYMAWPFDGLGGHYGLQTASEVRSDLRFEISDLKYLLIHVLITLLICFGPLLRAF